MFDYTLSISVSVYSDTRCFHPTVFMHILNLNIKNRPECKHRKFENLWWFDGSDLRISSTSSLSPSTRMETQTFAFFGGVFLKIQFNLHYIWMET